MTSDGLDKTNPADDSSTGGGEAAPQPSEEVSDVLEPSISEADAGGDESTVAPPTPDASDDSRDHASDDSGVTEDAGDIHTAEDEDAEATEEADNSTRPPIAENAERAERPNDPDDPGALAQAEVVDTVATGDEPAGDELSVDRLTAAFANLMGEAEEADHGALDVPTMDADVETDDEIEPDEVPSRRRPVTLKPKQDEDDEQDDGQVTPESIVEAMLFVGHPQNEPLTARLIASYLRGVSPNEVDQLIGELNATYQQQGAAYHIVSDDVGYRMVLREDLGWLRDAFYGRVREAKLTQAAIDLLAIVAYHQPVERTRVDALRGQPSGGILNQLVRRELLSVELTQDKPRKKLYRTTERFLDLFGLDSIEDLPSYEDF